MDILVGDLAKLFGLSSQTLHYYDEKGILNPQRDILNGYRYYEVSDLSRLGGIKKLRNAEFSLPDGLDICNGKNDWELICMYQKRKQELNAEIEKKQQIIMKLDEDMALYTRYQRIGNEITVEELEGFLRFESAGTHIIFQDQKMRQEAIPWFMNILHTSACEMYYEHKDTKEFSHFTYGMMANISTAKYLNLKATENVREIKSGLFITSMFEIENDPDSLIDRIQQCICYAKEHQKKIRGNPCIRNIFSYLSKEQKRKSLKQILIPVS